jgi:hypothetical protein
LDKQAYQPDPPTLPGQLNQSSTTQPADLPYPYPVSPDPQQYLTPLPYQPYPLQPLHAPQNDLLLPDYSPQRYPAQQPKVSSTRNQSFTGKAVIALLLYFLFYIPGLIVNIMFISQANRVRKETGQTPSGIGCLWATLVVSIIPLAAVLVIVTLFILQLISSAGSGGGA